jgi:glutamate carboxypeptidase
MKGCFRAIILVKRIFILRTMYPHPLQQVIQSRSNFDAEGLLELLREVVSIQSGTTNTEGIRKVQHIGQRELESLGFHVQLIEVDNFGPHLLAERLRPGRPNILLDGHVDTVFPPDSNPNFRIEGSTCFGQGVIDMKGGNICMLGALRQLHRSGALDRLSVRVLLVSDEEVGSPSSRFLIEKFAPQVDIVLVFEEAGACGEVVVGRSGIQVAEVRTSGVAGHAGNVKGIRRNAIEELSYKICALREAAYSLADEGILFSVGTITGGIAHNVIADSAACAINIRFPDGIVFDRLRRMFESITSIPHVPGTRTSLSWHPAGSPAMPVTERALTIANLCTEIGLEAGISVGSETRGGSSNANLWAHHGALVLDGLGPIGGDDHSEREWMSIPTLISRVDLVSRLLAKLSIREDMFGRRLPTSEEL